MFSRETSIDRSNQKGAAPRQPERRVDLRAVGARNALGEAYARDGIDRFPEVSEIEVIRHFTRLSTWNYAIDLGMYPLGSCTMKYNPRVNEFVARVEGLANGHPYQAHGTNPATAATVGYAVENLKSNDRGMVDVAALAAQMNEDVAALMVTNPNTLGVFEQEIHKIADLMHAKGGLLYMDGANMNALVGKARPGDFGVDVMHLNLHKTFSTPHGGGGPGSGPVAVKKGLTPFLPTPVVITKPDGTLGFEYNRPQSVGRVRAFYGNFGMFIRALAYIFANGPDGLRQTTEDAVLNANYIRKGLEGVYDLPYSTPSMHEVVFSDKVQSKKGVKTMDLAKRLIDYGFHPYTTAFPLIVPGALMIEPTESEPKEELDLFIEAMKSIAEEVEEDPQFVLDAPHNTRISRLDETLAARKPVLRWKPENSS